MTPSLREDSGELDCVSEGRAAFWVDPVPYSFMEVVTGFPGPPRYPLWF